MNGRKHLGAALLMMIAAAQGYAQGLDLPLGLTDEQSVAPPQHGDHSRERPPKPPKGIAVPLPKVDDKTRRDVRDIPNPYFMGEEVSLDGNSVVYVLDVSSSMIGERLEWAKEEVIRSVEGLSRDLSFNVLVYDCVVDTWRPGLQPATPENKEAFAAWLSTIKVRGATGTGPAVVSALGFRENLTIILLTDGDPNCEIERDEHRLMIRRQNEQGARIHVFAIFAINYYRMFCQDVAADSGGMFYDIR